MSGRKLQQVNISSKKGCVVISFAYNDDFVCLLIDCLYTIHSVILLHFIVLYYIFVVLQNE